MNGARDGFQHDQLPALDALGDGHFAFARQQRNSAHFAEVHPDRIIRFFERPGREIQIAIFGIRFFLDIRRFGRIAAASAALALERSSYTSIPQRSNVESKSSIFFEECTSAGRMAFTSS